MYGLGKWPLGDAVAPARDVVAKVTDTICQKLIEAGLNDAGQMNEANAGKVAALLTAMALGRNGPAANANAAAAAHTPGAAGVQQPVFALQFSPDLPLVGVGAPAGSYYPAVARGLGVQLVVPPHAHVANAVGAVLGQVAQRVHMTVTQPVRGTFKVFTPDGPLDFRVLDAALAHARVTTAEAALELAKLNLSWAVVVAPADGMVSKLTARVGQLVSPSMALAELVPTQTYVVANFKETQVGEMKPGQGVELEVDAFGGRRFQGVVESLSAGTGSRFALLPPDNASGNFVKVVQRVPVRIRWKDAPPDVTLRAGMSVVATVHTES
jgi:hypothetical protein